MSDIQQLLQLQPNPGIQRDGTDFDIKQLGYVDGKWVRFQRGKPRKMGGFKRIVAALNGPIRALNVTPVNNTARVLSCSTSGLQSLVVDRNGDQVGATVNRTPAGFVTNSKNMWSVASMYDDASGADQSIILAVATVSSDAVDTTNVGQVYYGNSYADAIFTPVTGVTCRGVFVTQPYAIYYGANGQVTWSNVNEPLNVLTGDAGSDRITNNTIVAGLPLSTGSGPGGLLFSLDSVIRMDWVGGQSIFRFSKLTTNSSIISQNAVIEMDGVFYWAGVDKFYVSDGQNVKELPNTMNVNWFFDNLNIANGAKVWVARNTRFGEIIWHFPYGANTECSHAVVFNVREQCWYDYESSRTAGIDYFEKPIKASVDNSLYLHEFGKDKVEGATTTAIESYFKTSGVGILSVEQAINRWSRLIRVEPDLIQTGNMTLSIVTKEFANSNEITAGSYVFSNTTEKIDMRVQGRIIELKFTSNVVGGDYEFGRTLLHVEAGDPRS
jgi:hypothetical protein